MSLGSQLILIIIHYISLFGLVISGLLSLILTSKRKKLIFLFLSFLFVGILSFVYYWCILFFIAGIFIMFFFLSLYLFVFQIELFGDKERLDEKINGNIKGTIVDIILPFLFCAAIGYLIYNYTSDFLQKVSGSGNIFIIGLSDIAGKFFTNYSLILIIIIAVLFVSFLWFIIISLDEK